MIRSRANRYEIEITLDRDGCEFLLMYLPPGDGFTKDLQDEVDAKWGRDGR